MRLFLIVLLAAAVAFGGCGGDDDSEPSTGADASAATTETAPSGVTETAPAEGTETEDAQQGSDDSDASGSGSSGGASDDSSSDDSSGDDSAGGGSAASGEDKQSATAAVTGFYAALSSGDGDKACDLMADAVKEQFTKALAQSQNKQGASCETLAGTVADAYPKQLRQRLGNLRVVKVTVNGDNANVTAKLPGAPASTLPLVRDGDGWKIQAPVGAGATP